MAKRKTFPKWPRTVEGMELRLCFCDVTVVWNIVAFLRYCAVRGEGFGSKYKPYFTWGMPRSSPAFQRALFACFLLFFCTIASLHLSEGKLTSSVPRLSWVQVDEAWKSVPRKLVTTMFCSKLSSVKCSEQTRQCFETVKQSFSFYKPFSFYGENL